jgi:hypothetical protein
MHKARKIYYLSLILPKARWFTRGIA